MPWLTRSRRGPTCSSCLPAYEPCGLNQIYSLKYGTVPIVRAVGGLDDTIEDYHPETQRGNGFKFKEYSPSGLLEAIRRALQVYHDRSRLGKADDPGNGRGFFLGPFRPRLPAGLRGPRPEKNIPPRAMNSTEILAKIIEITTAPVEMERRLANLADALAQIFGVSFGGIFFWDPHREPPASPVCQHRAPRFASPGRSTLGRSSLPRLRGEKNPLCDRRRSFLLPGPQNATGPFSLLSFSRGLSHCRRHSPLRDPGVGRRNAPPPQTRGEIPAPGHLPPDRRDDPQRPVLPSGQDGGSPSSAPFTASGWPSPPPWSWTSS